MQLFLYIYNNNTERTKLKLVTLKIKKLYFKKLKQNGNELFIEAMQRHAAFI